VSASKASERHGLAVSCLGPKGAGALPGPFDKWEHPAFGRVQDYTIRHFAALWVVLIAAECVRFKVAD